MARMPSIEEADRRLLVDIAWKSIRHGLTDGHALAVHPADFPTALKAILASFVTLHVHDQLRGCIGHLEAVQPLVVDVAENAFSAAFRDPRFAPVTHRELNDVSVQISVLSEPKPLTFSNEDDLLQQLRPGIDGLILRDNRHRGTFLPSVWESLPRPEEFLTHLKTKAGLAANHWSDTIEVDRYTTESFGDA